MRLRRRLTVVLGLLLVLGLAVSGVVVYTSVRSYLYGRMDDQLDVAQTQAYRYFVYADHKGLRPSRHALDARLSPDVYAVVLNRKGKQAFSLPSGSLRHPDPRPIMPSHLPVQNLPATHVFGRDAGVYVSAENSFALQAVGSHGAVYRAQAVVIPQGTLIVAVPVAPTIATLRSLVRVELLASLAVVVVGCALAWWLVRRELKPLEEMTQTAGAIAEGELGRRVPAGNERSEVGRLGRALNGMLAQIQAAFQQRTVSEERLRQFVADASHELRTPLTSIRGYTELLRKGALRDDEARQRALARVESEAIRMGVLVDDLLLLTRLDQGRPLERLPVDMVRISSEAAEDARAIDPLRPIMFESSGAVIVIGDPDRLRQVVHNLVRNAMVHTPPTTPVTVEVTRQGDRGRCRVIDDGPGMTTEQAKHAFDRLFRADPARTGGGTGLGLSIVRAIAEALDGSATVESAPGRGTVFTFEIPLAVEAPPAAPAEVPAAAPSEALVQESGEAAKTSEAATTGEPGEAATAGETATTGKDKPPAPQPPALQPDSASHSAASTPR